MSIFYSKSQIEFLNACEAFFRDEISPYASITDKEETIPDIVLKKLFNSGFLGAIIPYEFGGMQLDYISFGLLNEEAGKACTSVRSLITVQNMVGAIIKRWGSKDLKTEYLSDLAKGEKIGAFALTEPNFGSDASNIELLIQKNGDYLRLNGTKKWISFAQIADIILVFGKLNGKICCVLVPTNSEGLVIKKINGLLGARGCLLGEITFNEVNVPESNLIGNVGFGLFPVAFTGLDIGRYSIAWGCVGMAQACLNSSKKYVNNRKQFGETLANKQLIKQMLSDMAVDIKAARLMCISAGKYMDAKSRKAFSELLEAKYFATKMLTSVTEKAVQMHGANGLTAKYPVERFYRDGKIMSLIEGSDQMLQLMISRHI